MLPDEGPAGGRRQPLIAAMAVGRPLGHLADVETAIRVKIVEEDAAVPRRLRRHPRSLPWGRGRCRATTGGCAERAARWPGRSCLLPAEGAAACPLAGPEPGRLGAGAAVGTGGYPRVAVTPYSAWLRTRTDCASHAVRDVGPDFYVPNRTKCYVVRLRQK